MVANLHPNPNASTLTGSRPKYFKQNGSSTTITQVTVSGDYRAHSVSTAASKPLNVSWFEGTGGNSIGMVDGTDYVMAVTIYPASGTTSNASYVYMNTGTTSFSEIGLMGPGPWRIYGQCSGAYATTYNGQGWTLTGGSFSGPVELDKVMITEGAPLLTFAADYSDPIAAGTTRDGYALGMRPGKTYSFNGESYGTFKVRTGPDAGSLTDLVTWVQANPDTWSPTTPWDGLVTIPAGHNAIELSSTGGDSFWYIFEDVPYFDGDTTDGGGYTYAWTGTAGDSASTRSVAASGPTAQVFVGGTAKAVSAMRLALADGTLVTITQAGG